MATSVPSIASVTKVSAPTYALTAGKRTVPWYIWCGVLATTSASIGGAWDISWHRSIGRDAFFTPAHMAIYACGVIAAIICGYLIFATTFGHSAQLKDVSVNVLGFRAPLGAFIAAWGGIAMLTSAPFDNWWHAAYGLDIKVVSPPHTLLILGLRGVSIGVMALILAAMNRAAADQTAGDSSKEPIYRTLRALFLYLGGLMIIGQMFFLMEYTWDIYLHSTTPYIAMGLAIPVFFAVFSRASGHPWSSTITTSIYMGYAIAEILIFPLFPATPKLGPVYVPVTHLVPAKFPMLLIFPAIALDLLWQRTRSWSPWKIAIVSGIVFTAVLVAAEWPFASFLMSKASENRFFGTMYFGYNARPDFYERLRLFLYPARGLALAKGLVVASLLATVSTWIGLRFGGWMKTVQR